MTQTLKPSEARLLDLATSGLELNEQRTLASILAYFAFHGDHWVFTAGANSKDLKEFREASGHSGNLATGLEALADAGYLRMFADTGTFEVTKKLFSLFGQLARQPA